MMIDSSIHSNITYRCIKICHTVLEEQSDAVTKTATTPTKTSNQKTRSVKKELPKAVKHSHGNFMNNLHYVKLFTTVKNVYTVYQVMSHDVM